MTDTAGVDVQKNVLLNYIILWNNNDDGNNSDFD